MKENKYGCFIPHAFTLKILKITSKDIGVAAHPTGSQVKARSDGLGQVTGVTVCRKNVD